MELEAPVVSPSSFAVLVSAMGVSLLSLLLVPAGVPDDAGVDDRGNVGAVRVATAFERGVVAPEASSDWGGGRAGCSISSPSSSSSMPSLRSVAIASDVSISKPWIL